MEKDVHCDYELASQSKVTSLSSNRQPAPFAMPPPFPHNRTCKGVMDGSLWRHVCMLQTTCHSAEHHPSI